MYHANKLRLMRLCRSLSCACLMVFSLSVMAACPPAPFDKAALLELKARSWKIDDADQRQILAKNLLPCLAHTDPVLRDEIAFEALSFWMRNALLDTPTIQDIKQKLLQTVTITLPKTDAGFAPSFAALVLSEIARVDRRTPFLTAQERQEMVSAATQFMSAIQDYRGFDEQQGWRHQVAHGADWLWQLTMNPALSQAQLQQMMLTISLQIKTDQHAYYEGEIGRLAMPVLYTLMRPEYSPEEFGLWLNALLNQSAVPIKTSHAQLVRQHNIMSFLLTLHYQLSELKNEKSQNKNAQLKTILLPALQKMIAR